MCTYAPPLNPTRTSCFPKVLRIACIGMVEKLLNVPAKK